MDTPSPDQPRKYALPRLVLFARYPIAGQCKTRLIPAVGPNGAARIHKHLTERTVSLLRQSGCPVTIAITGAGEAAFQEWLGDGLTYQQQVEGDLTVKLLPFAKQAPVILFGADTPDLNARLIDQAIDGLKHHRVVIGPAEDGGYYLIAMRDPMPELLVDMPWSTSEVLPETLRRLEQAGIEPLLLETLSDCDLPEDLVRWPELTRSVAR